MYTTFNFSVYTMRKNEETLNDRAKYIQKKFKSMKGTAGDRIKKLARKLFLSESTIEKDLTKDVK